MECVFVDESIHERGDFIVTALVYAHPGVQGLVAEALAASGFRPGIDEFKSSLRMEGNPSARELRARLRHLLMSHCKVALVVCPVSERSKLGAMALSLVRQVADRSGTVPQTVFLDEGMSLAGAEPPGGCKLERNCDSRIITGIQLSDCAAYVASVLLLAELGLNTKTVEADDDCGAEEPIELAWSLWTALRYSLAGGTPAEEPDEDGYSATMLPFGLHVSPACSEAVRVAAEVRLSTVYVGCVH